VLRYLYCRAHNCVEMSIVQGTKLCWNVFNAGHIVVLRYIYYTVHNFVEISLLQGTQVH